ncbi:hypothetical protein BDFG_05208 [Blastomyces dermatitidis ATCC 26199]|nr:hypothetical protein BDFG_05208 [Blastomyces dermatitidis ATCC 26199]
MSYVFVLCLQVPPVSDVSVVCPASPSKVPHRITSIITSSPPPFLPGGGTT